MLCEGALVQNDCMTSINARIVDYINIGIEKFNNSEEVLSFAF